MNFVILPISQDYEAAGDFTWRARLVRSVKINLLIYGIFTVLGIIFVVYLLIKGDISLQGITTLIIAAANTFGILLVIILLGYGLVWVPRSYFQRAKTELLLKYMRSCQGD